MFAQPVEPQLHQQLFPIALKLFRLSCQLNVMAMANLFVRQIIIDTQQIIHSDEYEILLSSKLF